MSTTLFLSPHLDDAVFSCAGMIQRRVAAGERTLIATVFSEGSDLHTARRGEDAAAARHLGADVVHLGHPDAPFRTPGYRGFRELIFGWHPEDHQTVSRTAASLLALLDKENITCLFAPLGVGTHVDHRIVHESVKLLSPRVEITFYEDRPYAFAGGATGLRLRELGFDAGAIHVPSLLEEFRELPHVRKYLPAGPERDHCESLLLAPLANEIQATANSYQVECSSVETVRAHEAAEHYESQFTAFCGSKERLLEMDRLAGRRLGNHSPRVERYWKLPLPATDAQGPFR